jgi:EAL domain-containing protein (putative c-di-GMP-specific phosphodiesterase class I)/GGDEF domain-containing protein
MLTAQNDIPPALSDEARRARLDRLISHELVAPVFQPIVCLQGGEVAGFEALARPAKESGFAHAGELFAEAEHLGRLWDLESVTRRKCIEAAANFPDGLLLFLNSTPGVFADPRFTGELEASLRGSGGLVPGRMVLEITEATDEQVFEGLIDRVRALAGMGYQVAIDDAGAGTSGLKRLMVLRPHWLKLDKALIDSVDRDPFQHNFIRFLVHFARMSGVNVVAEGIERHEQLGTLIDLGVRFGQGFLLAKPAPGYQIIPDELSQWVKRRWSQRLTTPGGDPMGTPVGTLCQPATVVQAATAIDEVAGQLRTAVEAPGVVVQDGRRFVGWCPRGVALAAAEREPAGTPVGFVTSAGPASIAPDASLSEALEMVSNREDPELTAPLVVAGDDRIIGIVPLRTLLWAAGEQSGHRAHRRHPLTGLPGQVAADHKIESLIQHVRDGESLAMDQDAALIDLRRFEAFNAKHGYDLGDQLLLDLATLLRTTFGSERETIFLAHLSVDRFLAIGPSARMGELLRECVERFDRTLGFAGVSPGDLPNGRDEHPLTKVSLRVLWLPKIFSRIERARDLISIERRLRARAATIEHPVGTTRSQLVRDDAWEHPMPLRLSA